MDRKCQEWIQNIRWPFSLPFFWQENNHKAGNRESGFQLAPWERVFRCLAADHSKVEPKFLMVLDQLRFFQILIAF